MFEVDHPASQQWKRARTSDSRGRRGNIKDLHIELPPHLTFVPVDFEQRTLLEGLRMAGYRSEAPALFSWLAVTTYLTKDAIFGTLRAIATLAAGTEVIFDYWVPAELLDEEDRRFHGAGAALAAASGEPWRSFFEPASFAGEMRNLGFAEVCDLGPEEGNARYCAVRTDGIRLNTMIHLIRARLGRSAA